MLSSRMHKADGTMHTPLSSAACRRHQVFGAMTCADLASAHSKQNPALSSDLSFLKPDCSNPCRALHGWHLQSIPGPQLCVHCPHPTLADATAQPKTSASVACIPPEQRTHIGPLSSLPQMLYTVGNSHSVQNLFKCSQCRHRWSKISQHTHPTHLSLRGHSRLPAVRLAMELKQCSPAPARHPFAAKQLRMRTHAVQAGASVGIWIPAQHTPTTDITCEAFYLASADAIIQPLAPGAVNFKQII